MGVFNKKELEKIKELEKKLEEFGALTVIQLEERVENKGKQLAELNNVISKREHQLSDLNCSIEKKTKELSFVEEELQFTEFGFYEPKYNCMTSDDYKERIKQCREQQKLLIKSKLALNYTDNWQLEGSKAKGKAMNNDNMKMVLRAFNNECDVLITKAKFNNLDKIKERIKKSAEQIDKLNTRNMIQIRNEYLDLKFAEVDLCYEFDSKKQDEKETLRAQREAEREEKKLQQEIEEKRKDINKEKKHYESYLAELQNKLNKPEEDNEYISAEIEKAKAQLNEIDKNLKEIDYRESNKKAGYVYVISNIGAFGDDIYKIGMTRRLEPQERVDELGDASVPFKFDVHGMVFSDNAPELESSLHKAFENKKVNKVNNRKEFFKVKLDDIETVLNNNYDKHVTLDRQVDAEEFIRTQNLASNTNAQVS